MQPGELRFFYLCTSDGSARVLQGKERSETEGGDGEETSLAPGLQGAREQAG